jgi:polysaccharide export outer membrane protein
MRTATWLGLVAVLYISGCGISAAQSSPQTPPDAVPNTPPKQEAPQPPAEPAARLPAVPQTEPDPAKTDPAKMSAPAANGAAKLPSATGVDAKNYVLGAEDQIFISVWKSPEFSGSHMIRPDGKITIPLIGEVEAAGLTPEAFGTAIQEKLKKVLREPDVSVSVTQVNSKRYFIEGEVNKPGEYKLVVPTRVLEALVNAGGFKDFAKQSDITIMRGNTRLKFNYKAAIKGKKLDQNIYLEAGDILIVK